MLAHWLVHRLQFPASMWVRLALCSRRRCYLFLLGWSTMFYSLTVVWHFLFASGETYVLITLLPSVLVNSQCTQPASDLCNLLCFTHSYYQDLTCPLCFCFLLGTFPSCTLSFFPLRLNFQLLLSQHKHCLSALSVCIPYVTLGVSTPIAASPPLSLHLIAC